MNELIIRYKGKLDGKNNEKKPRLLQHLIHSQNESCDSICPQKALLHHQNSINRNSLEKNFLIK